jgi:hypothetical protein
MTAPTGPHAPQTEILPGVAEIVESLRYLVYLLREDAQDGVAVQSYVKELEERLDALCLLMRPRCT